jgi:hypothetical protein
MPEVDENPDLQFWRAIYEILQSARDALPYFSDPERIHWTHPDEEWKNDAEVESLEVDCSSETDALIHHYCAKHSWPRRSKNNARYFASRRIAWAIGFARIFTIPLSGSQTAAIPRPPQNGWELLQWLLTDAYSRRFPPRQKSPFYMTGADGKMIEVWT